MCVNTHHCFTAASVSLEWPVAVQVDELTEMMDCSLSGLDRVFNPQEAVSTLETEQGSKRENK